jgi:uncharacterized membrane protein YobD (UPF0266 family)
MAVTNSPFAALQLVGLMFPVVVLTLRAYIDMFDQRNKQSMQMNQEVRMKKASQAAIASLLFFILSAIITLGGIFTDGTQIEPYILPAWAITTLVAFGAYLTLVYFWYQKITDMAMVELI